MLRNRGFDYRLPLIVRPHLERALAYEAIQDTARALSPTTDGFSPRGRRQMQICNGMPMRLGSVSTGWAVEPNRLQIGATDLHRT
jgi:hypothetical protein